MSDYRDYKDQIEALDGTAEALTTSLGDAASMVTSFDGELQKMKASLSTTGTDVASLERGLSKGLRKAFDGLAFDGMKLSDALRTVANSMLDTAFNTAMKPVTNQLGGLLAQGLGGVMNNIFPFADGAAFSQGRVVPFANGGVVSQATHFPMRGATGLMGEAGPEAIMPLTRGPDGKLGVRSAGGGASPTVVMNITTADAQSFTRSRSQIVANMSRALSRGQRNA